MTKRRKDTDYLFLSARIRSLERNLLTAQRLEQLLQAPSAERCSQLLSDLGYDPIRDEATLQASLKKQREDVFAELERFMPEKELLDVFRIKYDYHNIKVLLKAPEGAERLLMDAGTIPAGDLQRQYAARGRRPPPPGAPAEAAEKAASSGPVWGEMETGDLSSRTCTSCGAELVCGPETAATTCPYCGNPTVLGGQLSGKLKPEYIIPFRMDKKTAIENLKKYYKGKAFLPKAFKESNHIEEIQGVYVPFWLYDGRMEARGAYKAEISESHREGDYIVTTTRHFDVARVGDADFVRVPVDGSSKMPDAHMDAIEPFDYSDLKPFSTAYLPGFLADRYDEDDKKCAARVLTRMKNSTAAALHDTLGGYTGVQTLSEQIDSRTLEPHYALLPVWMLHTRWKAQDFLFAMNGQTGKLIGDLPADKGRVAAWFAGISIPLMILTALIMLL